MGFRGQFALHQPLAADVRFGSKADIAWIKRDVRRCGKPRPLTARAPDKVGISAAPPKVYTHIAAVGPTPRECGVYLIFGAGIQDIDLRPQ
jgi:hypothetical protein